MLFLTTCRLNAKVHVFEKQNKRPTERPGNEKKGRKGGKKEKRNERGTLPPKNTNPKRRRYRDYQKKKFTQEGELLPSKSLAYSYAICPGGGAVVVSVIYPDLVQGGSSAGGIYKDALAIWFKETRWLRYLVLLGDCR